MRQNHWTEWSSPARSWSGWWFETTWWNALSKNESDMPTDIDRHRLDFVVPAGECHGMLSGNKIPGVTACWRRDEIDRDRHCFGRRHSGNISRYAVQRPGDSIESAMACRGINRSEVRVDWNEFECGRGVLAEIRDCLMNICLQACRSTWRQASIVPKKVQRVEWRF